MSEEQAQAFIAKMKTRCSTPGVMAVEDAAAHQQLIDDEGFDCTPEKIAAASKARAAAKAKLRVFIASWDCCSAASGQGWPPCAGSRDWGLRDRAIQSRLFGDHGRIHLPANVTRQPHICTAKRADFRIRLRIRLAKRRQSSKFAPWTIRNWRSISRC